MNKPRHSVLVVEDNSETALLFGLLVHHMGHEVLVVNDGPAALEAASTFRPEVVVLDLAMPGMDGFEVARRLRERPETKEAVLVAMTGYGSEEDRRKSKEAGIDHHLVKPVARGDFEALLSSL